MDTLSAGTPPETEITFPRTFSVALGPCRFKNMATRESPWIPGRTEESLRCPFAYRSAASMDLQRTLSGNYRLLRINQGNLRSPRAKHRSSARRKTLGG